MNHIKNTNYIKDANISRNHPIHISPHYVCLLYEAFLNNSNIYITPKADGTTEFLHDSETGIYYDSENIDNKYLIFNSYTRLPHHKQHSDHIFFTGKMLDMYDNSDMLIHANKLSTIEHENLNYKFDKKYNIKKIFKIDKQFFKNTFEELLNLLSTNPNTSFSCDGWIVFSDYFLQIFKFKTIEHLTIDVSYDGTKIVYPNLIDVEDIPDINSICIIRLKYNKLTNKWKFDKIREDKKLPNRIRIIDEIVSYVNSNIKYNECIVKYNETKNSYYKKKDCSNMQYPDLFNDMVNYIYRTHAFANILDLGCGDKNIGIYEYIDTKYKYVGINKDCTHFINSIKNDIAKSDIFCYDNVQFLWGDMCSEKMEFFTDILKNCGKFNTILLNNTICYALDNDTALENLMNNINKCMNDSGIVVISSFILDFIEELDDGNDISIKHIDDNNYKFIFPWFENPLINKVISIKTLEYMAKQLNYVMKIHKYHIKNLKTVNYNRLLDMQRIIVLHK
jgi:SAM-dependent methyltransferase